MLALEGSLEGLFDFLKNISVWLGSNLKQLEAIFALKAEQSFKTPCVIKCSTQLCCSLLNINKPG